MRNVWRDDFMGYWGVVMQDRGYELPRILILETVWKVGWRGVNEARSLACNAKIRSPCPSMLASVAPVWCPSGLSRQSLEVDFGHLWTEGVGYARHRNRQKEVIDAHPTNYDDTGPSPLRATVFQTRLPTCSTVANRFDPCPRQEHRSLRP